MPEEEGDCGKNNGVSKWVFNSIDFVRRSEGRIVSESKCTEAVEIVHPAILIFRR
jgi:hypothetical protein